MKKLIFTTLLLVVCNLILIAQSKLTKEEYEIYATILRQIYYEEWRDAKSNYTFLILDTTGNAYIFDIGKVYKIKGLAKHFKQTNKYPAKVENSFPIKYNYETTNISEIERLLKIGAKEFDDSQQRRRNLRQPLLDGDNGTTWKYFYQKHPNSNGYYQFSRIGFSSTKEFALVNLEYIHTSGGSSINYILRKVKRKWKIYSSGGNEWIE